MVNKHTQFRYGFWILLCELAGLFSALLSLDGMKNFDGLVNKPPLTPPPIVFVTVWIILYAFMGIGAALICNSDIYETKTKGLNLFITQLILNFFWSPIFFNTGAYGFAFLWLMTLLVVVLYMQKIFSTVCHPAGKLQIPYIVWLCIAGYLNLGVWFLNQ